LTSKISERIAANRSQALSGREELRRLLNGVVEIGQPPIWYVHGIAGVGKTALARLVAEDLTRLGSTVLWIDCQSVPPTPAAFLEAVSDLVHAEASELDDVARALASTSECTVLILDEYEAFRLLDTWFRQVFIPALSDQTRIVLLSKLPPSLGWMAPSEWASLVRVVSIGPLDRETSIRLLIDAGFSQTGAESLARLTGGHPLALQLAISVNETRSEIEIAELTGPKIVDTLTRLFLEDLPTHETRELLEAASVVRRTTRPRLRTLMPQVDPDDAFTQLASLPVVEPRADGLSLNQPVQNALALAFRYRDIHRYRTLRRAAWRQLRDELRSATEPDLWRLTADLLFLIENPVLREGFFPSGGTPIVVEPSRATDLTSMLSCVERFAGAASSRTIGNLWNARPGIFFTTRSASEPFAGFLAITSSDALPDELAQTDPIFHQWTQHLHRNPLPPSQKAIFVREALANLSGEHPSKPLAAAWIEAKRLYIEMRPALGRTYTITRDLDLAMASLSPLGFRHEPRYDVELGGIRHHTLVLDFGLGSIEGWLSRHLEFELAADENPLLDIRAHALRIDGTEIGLSKLEFAVIDFLSQRPGEIVSRTQLLHAVWGIDFEGGSNVVDVVIGSLRRKLGPYRHCIGTAHGIGYRFVPPEQ
jgi:hypothetical protein